MKNESAYLSLRGVHRLRLVLAVACFASVVFAPWWVPAIIAVILCFRFRAWEVILAGMFMDLYWMPAYIGWGPLDSLPLATIVAIILVFGFEPIRRQLLLGPEFS
jgi:hypothetical protein